MAKWDRKRKHELMIRLERESRWAQAQSTHKSIREEFAAAGVPDAASAAWDEVERIYSPMTQAEIDEERRRKAEEAVAAKAEEEAKKAPAPSSPAPAEVSRSAEVRVSPVPESWLPIAANAKYRDEVDWARQNRFLCLRRLPSGDRLDLSKAQTPPPSHYAIDMLILSVENRVKFAELVHKEMQDSEEGTDKELVRRERTKIEEIRRILEAMREPAA